MFLSQWIDIYDAHAVFTSYGMDGKNYHEWFPGCLYQLVMFGLKILCLANIAQYTLNLGLIQLKWGVHIYLPFSYTSRYDVNAASISCHFPILCVSVEASPTKHVYWWSLVTWAPSSYPEAVRYNMECSYLLSCLGSDVWKTSVTPPRVIFVFVYYF